MTCLRPVAALTLALLSLTVAAHAQQSGMPAMPGMSMPNAPAPQKQKAGPLQTPADMKSGSGENARAKAAEKSVENSEAQQRSNAGGNTSQSSDTQSLHHDTYAQQEFEAPDIHTGADMPAPELLGEAAARPALTLQQIETWADAANPTLAEARALVKRSEGLARQAGLPPNPSVGYSGEHLRGGSYGGGENGAFAEQTLVLGGKLRLRRDIYTQQAVTNRIEIEAQTLRVHSDAERAFYDALTVQAEVEVRRKLLANAQNAVRTAHELANLGQQDAPEVLDAEVEAEQAKMEYEQAQRKYLGGFAALVSLAGHPGEPASRLHGDLEKVPQLATDAVVAEVVGASPVVRQAQQEIQIAEAKLRAAQREPIPNLRVQAGAWWSGEQLSGEPLNANAKAAGWMGFAQAGIQLPLWNRNQGNIEAARAELERSHADVLSTQLSLRQRAEPLAQRYLAARVQAERYRDAMLPRAERAHDLYLLKYRQMAAAYPQVLLSERTALRLRLAYLEALQEEWRALIALRNHTLDGGPNTAASRKNADTALNLPAGGTQ